jgi:trigger factor
VKVEYVEETSVKKSLTFEIEAEVVDREIESRARDYAKKIRLPGFRPGKVPLEVVKTRFKDQVLGDVAETIVNRVVMEELQGRGLRPLASPKVAELKIDEKQPMTFRAVFETLPLVQLPEYRGLSVTSRAAKASEEDVDKEIDRMREEAARFDPVEGRAAAKGGRDENALIEVGGEGNHADMNAALEGMTPGETKQVTVVYPDDYASSSVAGKTVAYTVTLKAIKSKVVPAADDEFAKDLGEFASLAELREQVRGRLQTGREREIDRETKQQIVRELVERASFEVPEALVDRHLDARLESAVRDLAYQGVDPRKAEVDWKAVREGQREGAVKAAKAEILLDEVARREGVEALAAEIDAEVARYAERMRKSAESIKRQMEKEGALSALAARIREEKTLDLLKANARLIFEQ